MIDKGFEADHEEVFTEMRQKNLLEMQNDGSYVSDFSITQDAKNET